MNKETKLKVIHVEVHPDAEPNDGTKAIKVPEHFSNKEEKQSFAKKVAEEITETVNNLDSKDNEGNFIFLSFCTGDWDAEDFVFTGFQMDENNQIHVKKKFEIWESATPIEGDLIMDDSSVELAHMIRDAIMAKPVEIRKQVKNNSEKNKYVNWGIGDDLCKIHPLAA